MLGYLRSILLLDITKSLLILMLVMTLPRAAAAQCGNGLLDRYEQCDDGNLVNQDGCSRICQIEGDAFPVLVYETTPTPPTPDISELPKVNSITRHGITWTFRDAQHVGRFVNGDYYVVGDVVITVYRIMA